MHNLKVIKKRNLTFGLVTCLFLMNFVSAFDYGGSFSLGELLDSVDNSTMILGSLSIIFFTFINFVLTRFFKHKDGTPMKGPAAVVALAMSILMVWGLNKTGLDYEDFLSNLGISGDLLGTILPIILLVGIVILIWKFKSLTLLLIGALFIVAGMTGWLYEEDAAYMIGGACIVVWILWKIFFRHKDGGGSGLGGRVSSFGRGAGSGAKWGWGKAKDARAYMDPRNRLARRQTQQAEDYAKEQARRDLRKHQEQAKKERKIQIERDLHERNAERLAHEEEARRRQQTQRTAAELQAKYNHYRHEAATICEKVGHTPPARGTPEYHQWSKYTQAVKIIENMAAKQGITLH